MPATDSFWILTAPLADNDPHQQLDDIESALNPSRTPFSSSTKHSGSSLARVGAIQLPELKTGTLASLITLSESTTKHDQAFEGTINKIVDCLKGLVNNDPKALEKHLTVEDGQSYSYEDYLFPSSSSSTTSGSRLAAAKPDGWQWNRAKFRYENRDLSDIVDTLVKEMASIDSVHKAKLGDYNLVKGQLQQLQRKKTGNLATRSLADVVSPDDFIKDSEYLETVLVAVPKNSAKDWESKYERLTSMVVPRSSHEIARDDEFVLYGVTIFRRVKDEFVQKCRENKFTVREFTYDESALQKQEEELKQLEQSEKELYAELLRLTRINFSEAFQAWVHLKVLRAFIESVLRYGLPANYFAAVLKPDKKQARKLVQVLSTHFEGVVPSSNKSKKKAGGNSDSDDAVVGEFQSFMEQEYFDFVLFEIPLIGKGDKD